MDVRAGARTQRSETRQQTCGGRGETQREWTEDEGRANSRKMGRTWSTIAEQEVWAQKSKHTAGAPLRQIRRQKRTPTHTHARPPFWQLHSGNLHLSSTFSRSLSAITRSTGTCWPPDSRQSALHPGSPDPLLPLPARAPALTARLSCHVWTVMNRVRGEERRGEERRGEERRGEERRGEERRGEERRGEERRCVSRWRHGKHHQRAVKGETSYFMSMSSRNELQKSQ